MQGIQNSQNILRKENKVGWFTLSEFITNYKDTVTHRSIENNRESRNKSIYP